MPVSAEKYHARQQAIETLKSVDAEQAALDAKRAAAQAALKAANDAIALDLAEGESCVETPAPVPALIKINGELQEVTIQSIHPAAAK